MHLLVIEDERALCETIVRSLRRLAYSVDYCYDGEKALELLAPHEEHFAEDHCWNYRIASAYYFLDEEGPALRYFEKALKARPGDKDTQEYIDDCRRRLSLPRFEKNYRSSAGRPAGQQITGCS